jgi:Protein of unknown function (DUF3780)
MAPPTRGFGFDESSSPYYFALLIPRSSEGTVAIEERWQAERGSAGPSRGPERLAELPRPIWDALSGAVRDEFTKRLKAEGKRAGEFHEGENLLAPELGKELVLLLWAAESAGPEVLNAVATNWRGLAPAERWWLFTTVDASRDHPEHGPHRGWRKAIKIAFAENPVIAAPAGQRRALLKRRPAGDAEPRAGRRAKKPPMTGTDPTQQLSLLEGAP